MNGNITIEQRVLVEGWRPNRAQQHGDLLRRRAPAQQLRDVAGDLVRFLHLRRRARHGGARPRPVSLREFDLLRNDLEDVLAARIGSEFSGRIARERHAGEIFSIDRLEESQFAGREVLRVVDESERVSRTDAPRNRGIRAETFDRERDRIAPGRASPVLRHARVSTEELREQLGKIDLPPVLPLQLGCRNGEGVAVLALRRVNEIGVREIRRIRIELRRPGER